MDKDEVHMYTRILLSHKAEWTNAMCNMDGPGDGHTKWSKSDKDKYDIVDMQNLKKKKKWYRWTYLQNRNRLTDLGNSYQRDRLGVWDWYVHTVLFKTANQQGPTVQHRELCSILCNSLNGKIIWKRIDTGICITLLYTWNITLFIQYYIPI